jgi:hypothetical protein
LLRALLTCHRHSLSDASCLYVSCREGKKRFFSAVLSSFLLAVRNQNRSLRRRRELVTTLMELSAMAASARRGWRSPTKARGMATTL